MNRNVEIRLCWPNPDWCCLEGGCGYCSGGREKDHKWKTAQQWQAYAEKKGLLQNWSYGCRSQWPNRDKRPAR